MRVNGLGVTGVNAYKQSFDNAIINSKKAEPKKDQVQISSAAYSLHQEPAWSVNRQEQLRALKEEIQGGTYKMDHEAIAKSVYDHYFN